MMDPDTVYRTRFGFETSFDLFIDSDHSDFTLTARTECPIVLCTEIFYQLEM